VSTDRPARHAEVAASATLERLAADRLVTPDEAPPG
jgi:hypothetical protein